LTEVRSQRTEVSLRPIGAYAPVGGQKGRGQKSEDRGQRSEDRGQRSEGRRSEGQKIRVHGLDVEFVPRFKTKI